MSHLKHLPGNKDLFSLIAPRFIKKGKEATDFILVLVLIDFRVLEDNCNLLRQDAGYSCKKVNYSTCIP